VKGLHGCGDLVVELLARMEQFSYNTKKDDLTPKLKDNGNSNVMGMDKGADDVLFMRSPPQLQPTNKDDLASKLRDNGNSNVKDMDKGVMGTFLTDDVPSEIQKDKQD
jgi:hypothetical protein